MITALTLENWKSHSSSAFSFGKGTNILLGRMGSGKSSVTDAICFALYGTFPKMSRRESSTESVVNLTSGAEYAHVQLEFERGGKKYIVARKIGKKISEAEVSCDGKLAQKGPKPVTDYVIDALGVNYELFTRAIYSEQNRMDALLSLTPKARKQEIDWLLGLGEFDEAREAAQSAAGKLSEQAEICRREADSARIAEAEAKAEGQKKLEAEKKEACSLQERALDELEAKRKGKTEELSALEKTRIEHGKRKSECEVLTGSVQRLSREAEGKIRASKAEVEYLLLQRKGLEAKLAAAKSARKRLADALSSAKSELAVLQSARKTAEERARRLSELGKRSAEIAAGKSIAEIEAGIAAKRAEGERIASERALLLAEAEGLEAAVEALSGASAKCPVCDSDISHGKSEGIADGKRKLAGEKRALAESNGKLVAKNKSEITVMEKALSELRLCNSQIERLKSEGASSEEIEGKIAAAEGRGKAAEADASKAEADGAADEALLEDVRGKHEAAARTEKLFYDYDDARERLACAQGALAALLFDEGKYESARRELEALSVECAQKRAALEGERKQLKLVAELTLLLSQECAELKKKGALAAKYEEAAASMAIYKNSLSATQTELRGQLVEEINEALAEIWPAIYPYSDYEKVLLEADEKDYRLLMSKGGMREVDAIASGGERACLCLSLRIAFATVLTPDIGWLILDEPTHNLDSDAVALLSEAINHKIPQIVEQTFVITHESALGETSEGAVFRLERDKSKGESTKVEAAS